MVVLKEMVALEVPLQINEDKQKKDNILRAMLSFFIGTILKNSSLFQAVSFLKSISSQLLSVSWSGLCKNT